MAMGRPTKYKPEYCEMIIEHMKDGSSATSFAASINVHRDTISEWVNVHPEFSVAFKTAKAHCAVWWERLARSNAVTGDGNAALCIFGLKNMSPQEWKDKQELDTKHTYPQLSESEVDAKLRQHGVDPDGLD